ncbi:helix-turn-helix domain-containing protein [Botrimarina sp.]|uniref:helix-turn-helix domain-containing protein n=1 Tax=Botrimarina sp. TaxID=2795802 RepID=UPI0032F00FA5
MPTDVFTPKQIAEALGVSESSVKRWVDNGRLPGARTVGGHRKVPMASLADFVRETGQAVVRPDVVGMAPVSRRRRLESLQDTLFDALISGDEAACRNLVLGAYQHGDSVSDLGDRLIGPVFSQIGEGWAAGEVAVRQERRSCEVMMATLHELRRWLAPATDRAPRAVVATPHSDFAEVPARLVELVLLSAGWRVEVAGSGLPLEEIRAAVQSAGPRLFCLSVTHVEDPDRFLQELGSRLMRPLGQAAAADGGRIHRAIGGSALMRLASEPVECELFATSLNQLAARERDFRDA